MKTASGKNSAIYGVDATDLEGARNIVEWHLGLRLAPHDSLYFGGNYFRFRGADGEEVVLRPNHDLLEGSPEEPDFADKPFLLYVQATGRSTKLWSMLSTAPGVELLRRAEP